MKRHIFLLLLLSLLSVSCQNQLDQVADNSGTAGEENGNNPIQEERLSGVEGVFKFQIDEREWRIFEMEFNRVTDYPGNLIECEELEEAEGEAPFDEMYIRFNKDEEATGNQGTIDRVEVKVLEDGELCKTKDEVLSYSYDNEVGILTFDSEDDDGVRYIQEVGDDQLLVKNSEMVGRWIMNGEDELHIGEFVTSRFSFNRTETVLGSLEPCEIDFDYNRLESYVNFYATDHMEIFYTMRLDNGDHCLSTDLGTIVGHYEFRTEENQFSIYFPVGNRGSWGEQIYNYESINQDKFYFLYRSSGTTSPDEVEP